MRELTRTVSEEGASLRREIKEMCDAHVRALSREADEMERARIGHEDKTLMRFIQK